MGTPTILKITENERLFDNFDVFFYVVCRVGPFLMSWRPGNILKSFLEVVRFFWTDYGPVGMHGDPNRMHFHDFPYHPTLAPGLAVPIRIQCKM